MKKSLLSIVALLAVGALSAQESETVSEGFKAGDAFITGSVSYDYTKNDASKVNQFGVGPSVGYFVSDKIALGISGTYSTIKSEGITYPSVNKTKSYSAGVFGRYYFTPANKFSFFGNLRVSYNHNKLDSNQVTERTGSGFGVQAGPGINYFISPRFSLQTSLGFLSYGSSKTKLGGVESTSNGFNAGLDFSNLSFGLLYKL